MLQNDLNLIDLVLTHLNHPWGPPGWFDALNSVLVVIFGHFRQEERGEIANLGMALQIFLAMRIDADI